MNKKKPSPMTPASPADSAFWYCKVPKSERDLADKKRKSVKASKVSVMLRMIKWYLKPETEA